MNFSKSFCRITSLIWLANLVERARERRAVALRRFCRRSCEEIAEVGIVCQKLNGRVHVAGVAQIDETAQSTATGDVELLDGWLDARLQWLRWRWFGERRELGWLRH